MVPRPCHYLASPLDACGPGSVPERGLGAGLACGGGLCVRARHPASGLFPRPATPVSGSGPA